MKRIRVSLAAGLALTSCAQHQSTAVKTPLPPSAMQRQVLNAVDAGDGDVELRALRERVIDSPADLKARLELARAYEQRGLPELALDHYRWAQEHSPQSSEAHLALAQALNRAGRSTEAISSLDNFLKAYPQNDPKLYTWLGILRDDAEDWKGSEQAYREAIAQSREDHDYLHNNLGYSLLKQGQNEKAAAEFRLALKLNPHSEIARNNLGMALASDSKEAIVNLQSMNAPAIAHSNLAAVLIEQGKFAEARKELQSALEYNRTNSAVLRNLELLSNLDGGKPVSIPAAMHQTRWARLKTTWRKWWGGSPSPAAQQQTQTASQQLGSNSAESKQ